MNLNISSRADEVEAWILECRKRKINGTVVTLPGMGMTHLAKNLEKRIKGVSYIPTDNLELNEQNIVYLDWLNQPNAFEVLDKYFMKAEESQKFVVVIDDPTLIDLDVFIKSYASKHIYDYFWFAAMDENETSERIDGWIDNCSAKDKKTIFELSGGITQIVKYLCLNTQQREVIELSKEMALRTICEPMVRVIKTSPQKYLETLRISKSGVIKSKILSELLEDEELVIDIKIKPDLTLVEDGEESGARLARVERDILIKQLSNSGFISKEEVAMIKWGNEDFSNFSDQAINKTMRRIDGRLKKYRMETKSKIGFVIRRRKHD